MGKETGAQNSGAQTDGIDWVKMEPEFIHSPKSLRVLATEYGCGESTIRKHFKGLGVKRDPSRRIKAKAADKVRKAQVRKQVLENVRLTEKKVIEVAAQVEADVIMDHRTDISNIRTLISKLQKRIEDLIDNDATMEKIIKLLKKGDDAGAAKVIDKVSSLPVLVKMIKELVAALKDAIALEREAFGINKTFNPADEEPDGFEVVFRHGK